MSDSYKKTKSEFPTLFPAGDIIAMNIHIEDQNYLI